MKELDVEGAWAFVPDVHRDKRGSFLEWFRNADLGPEVGYPMQIAQVNCSVSARGAIRGIHFSQVPPGQAKYVMCASGAVTDVVVDIRRGSPGFGRWTAIRLDDEQRQAVYLSEGLGHAFMALSDQATVVYLCSTPYTPSRDHGVNPLDPAIGIAWPAGEQLILSDKDAAAPSLAETEAAGLLPDYADCQAYAAKLRGGM
jgi:dTDP-4-dehydrorhamnose 3,5-epimerase